MHKPTNFMSSLVKISKFLLDYNDEKKLNYPGIHITHTSTSNVSNTRVS